MKELDPGTSLGIRDFEASLSSENGAILTREPKPRRGFGEPFRTNFTVTSLRLLWENRSFLLRVAGLGLVLSTLFAFSIPNRYQSVAHLMPPDNHPSSGLGMAAAAFAGGLAGLGGFPSEMLGLRSTSDLLVGVLGSRTVQDNLIQRFDLKKVYGSPRMKMQDARKDLANSTAISVDRRNQIITIKVSDKSPQRAAALAQAYVEELNRTLAAVSTSAARRERVFLEGRLQAVSLDLESAEKEFSQFASQNTTIDLKEQGKAMVESATVLEGQLIAARSELQGLRQIYADSNVRIRSLQARIAELENQLRIASGDKVRPSSIDPTQDDSLYPSIRQLPLLGVRYADLYRKTAVEEAVFERLTQEYELAKVQEAKEIPTVKVLDPASVPERKSFPPHLVLMLLGTTFWFAWGVAWALGRTWWRHTDSSDPRKALAQEVFCTMQAATPWAFLVASRRRLRNVIRWHKRTKVNVRPKRTGL
jgi:uncharacterized protein involved in exopolysaccharide biosynthesis